MSIENFRNYKNQTRENPAVIVVIISDNGEMGTRQIDDLLSNCDQFAEAFASNRTFLNQALNSAVNTAYFIEDDELSEFGEPDCIESYLRSLDD